MDTRRELLKKAAYAVPAILTLKAVPAYAGRGSRRGSGSGGHSYGGHSYGGHSEDHGGHSEDHDSDD